MLEILSKEVEKGNNKEKFKEVQETSSTIKGYFWTTRTMHAHSVW